MLRAAQPSTCALVEGAAPSAPGQVTPATFPRARTGLGGAPPARRTPRAKHFVDSVSGELPSPPRARSGNSPGPGAPSEKAPRAFRRSPATNGRGRAKEKRRTHNREDEI